MTVALHGGRLIDGTGADPQERATVLVEDTRIVQIGTELDPPRDAQTFDVAGMTVLPGLIDAHSHFGILSAQPRYEAAALTAARIFRNCELALDAGFTTVRDVGGLDGGVAAAVEAGLIRGPRILPSGPVLCQTGGHGDMSPPFALLQHHHVHGDGIPGLTMMALPCDGPDEVRVAARTVLRRGATQVKVCVSGGVVSLTDRLEDTQFSVEELMAAVAEAHARDTYVTAHAHNAAGIRNGLAAGVECFEHGSFLDEATVEAMAQAGAMLVPTFAVLEVMRQEWRNWGMTEDMLARVDEVATAMAGSMKLARDAGITIGLGSDLFGPEQNRRGLELTIRSQLEDPMAAIVAATATNARILRCLHDRGTVEPGKRADLTVLDGDPLDQPELFDDPDRVVLVVRDGRVVKDRLA